ncbi:MAG: flavin reductase [Acholeplasmatales bacterium]|jgi:flavorubredoxin/flavin reductase (DIM6/NTAB) family NADH-FMN oxidoreductase RutF|nr:flavin reductase [Acholeplasmatales bacterium]
MKIINIGVNDHEIDLFEGQYLVPQGISYNSYLLIDEQQTIIVDTVDKRFSQEWLDNIKTNIHRKQPSYLIITHMEPDHSSSIKALIERYPKIIIIANSKAHSFIKQFFPLLEYHKMEVTEKSVFTTDSFSFKFIMAPMVHWPEVMFVYEENNQIIFSADAFGKFGALDITKDEPWLTEARRYYIGIVGQYGPQVVNALKKISSLAIKSIYPLHGPILSDNLSFYINKYLVWANYQSEEKGIVIVYNSVYGNTKEAVNQLSTQLANLGLNNVKKYDIARTDLSLVVSEAFRFDTLVLAATTYNARLFPAMNNFIDALIERNYQNRHVAIVENGTWNPVASSIIKEKFSSLKSLSYLNTNLTIRSALSPEEPLLAALAAELYALQTPSNPHDDKLEQPRLDLTQLFNLSYGLYVIFSTDGAGKYNGCILNSVAQVTSKPNRVSVTINKDNYTCELVLKTGILNISSLTTSSAFSLFERFGFASGRTKDKFLDFFDYKLASNNLPYLSTSANGYLACKVFTSIDLGTHIMFILDISEAVVLNKEPSLTYTYYQTNIKPARKDAPATKQRCFVCQVCGFEYYGESLPPDYICPLCKHGAEVFEEFK